MKNRKLFQSITITGALYGFVGWLYIVINSEVHIQTLGMPLTHFLSWPHEDTFGAICFAISVICFFTYSLIRNDRS